MKIEDIGLRRSRRVRRAALFLILLFAAARPAAADDATLALWRQADSRTQESVLSLARRAFDTYVRQRALISPPASLPPLLRGRVGIFISTMRNGAPRCCMGTIFPTEPDAAGEIIANAATAGGRDRRFRPIQPAELDHLILIVSAVGGLRPLAPGALAGLDPARDGLAVRYGDRFGVVLSGETDQVARMLRWGRIRAGARPSDPVELFRLDVVRFVEKPGFRKGK